MKATQFYDFTTSANGTMVVFAAGSYFRILSSTGAIQVGGEFGQIGPLLAGQGLRNKQFSSITIKDLTGNANKGIIIVGDQDFVDDRITGEVSVIDGGKARTIAGNAFTWNPTQTSGAGGIPMAQLWNPAGSGKNVIVSEGVIFTQVAGGLYLGIATAALSAAGQAIANKRSLSATAPVAQPKVDSLAAQAVTTKTFGVAILPAAGTWSIQLREPLVIEPGTGLVFQHNTVGASTISGMFEFFEEPQ